MLVRFFSIAISVLLVTNGNPFTGDVHAQSHAPKEAKVMPLEAAMPWTQVLAPSLEDGHHTSVSISVFGMLATAFGALFLIFWIASQRRAHRLYLRNHPPTLYRIRRK